MRDIRKYAVFHPAARHVPKVYRQKGTLLPVLLVAAFLSCGPGIRAPEVRLRSVSARSAQETVVGLAIYNPNRFPLRVRSVDYEVSVGEKLCGSGRREEPLFLDARDTTDAEFSLTLDWGGVAKAIPALLTDSVVFGVEGRYVVSTVFGRRRFGFNGRRTVSVKDMVGSFIENLFGE
jgi:LEA14-like dessication related protein